MIPPYGKIHVSLSNEYVEFYEEKSLKDTHKCTAKENGIKVSCEEEESTTVGCTRDDIFMDGHTDEKDSGETNHQRGYHHSLLSKHHLRDGKGGDTSQELTSSGVRNTEVEKGKLHVEPTTALLVPPVQDGGGKGSLRGGDGGVAMVDSIRSGRSSHGEGSSNQVKCKSRRALPSTVRLKGFKKICNRTFNKYYFIGKPFRRYVKIRKSASQEKVKKNASRKVSTDGIVISKKKGAQACHGPGDFSVKRQDMVSSESAKTGSEVTMGEKAHTEGNIIPVKKCVHQVLLPSPKVRIVNRGNVILSKMTTKENNSKKKVEKVEKVKKIKIVKKIVKEGKPIDLKRKNGVDEDAGQHIGEDNCHTHETSTVSIQKTKFHVHTEKCETMGKGVVNGKEEITNGSCSSRIEANSLLEYTEGSPKKKKKKKRKKKKKNKGTPEGGCTIGGGGHTFGEGSPGDTHLTGKFSVEGKPNGNAAMREENFPERVQHKMLDSLQKTQIDSGQHSKEGVTTATPNGVTVHNEEKWDNKSVREIAERKGEMIKKGEERNTSVEEREVGLMVGPTGREKEGGKRKKKKKKSESESVSVSPIGNGNDNGNGYGSGNRSEDGGAGRQKELKPGELNMSEYLILKEIKIKQSNEVVQLNLDSSFFVSKGAGLYNYGQNICFFNSIIQTIVRIPYICKDLLNKLHSLNCEKKKVSVFCFYCLFEQFACNIISKKCGIKNMLIPYIKKYICNNYIVGYQEDVHEYLRYFLCSLERSSFSSSIYIQKMFTGVTKNITICTKCNNVSLKYEQYYELSLDISSSNNLEEALKKYLSKETLMGDNGYYCDNCRKKKKATKQCVINKLPRVLTIQIKRFFMNSKFNVVKNHKHISYPLYLDMKGYVNNYDLFQNDFNNNVISLYEKVNSSTGGISHQGSGVASDTRNGAGSDQRNGAGSDQRNGAGSDQRNGVGSDQRNGASSNMHGDNQSAPQGGRPNPHVLNQIAHIFAELKREVCKRKIKNQLTSSDLRSIIMETKKRIIKELNKIKFSKFYNDILLSISKDIDTLYCHMRANANSKHFSLKGALFNFKVEYLSGQERHLPSHSESCTTENGNRSETNRFGERREHSAREAHNGKNHSNQRNASYFSYELTGLIKHIGSGTEYGHYVALTKSNNNIYLLCDDNNISYINKKDILNCVKNAYVFIYTCIHPRFIDFYNKYVDVLEKKKFNINLPVFEKRVEFKERITMPKQKFISRSLHF
ncbi:ubiquitin carboxyl-terminal hydrolase, putative [Plasmodium knowlesi strain H]|uniref:ubiquitinyl hydrolase 1 n=3 Tax=Plasmodium knowlesi TaxID=5850 RepID=A0A5K1VE46_PLAKH|nr:ubiquitin carboxyl-terminal hydrolase, putative [Plasmodium knowlesi strain H]OTN67802.1 putative Ubiquitin carboxyl-terminal hydrolase [Plasmodium knowlesi]CAA9990459.1 ubiquitin carboxyl-terminal hydrolase, putative [Plasmodium knowlesi strain H]SBO19665.1 ubiquitin carboxyl-terminal hydrolase, putative [Plasmodium knowlesi strain H]SBO22504.1 ubiquitin carboxyl-terminal hydrolase, putative [Plasmodium knowlesi strain H]VVS79933.1 ubiquitin carboxyl-terminal hydrolase, putative [Plasmodiu|eukprot:XP_002260845.1 Ubiquitin carboxyl-terminal hydrolase, putative [Plasmodium knowlesi strain H]